MRECVHENRDRRPVLAGMCKWTSQPVDVAELNLLNRLVPHVGAAEGTDLWLFSRSGFTERLTTYAGTDPHLHVVTPADIYRTSQTC